MEEVEEGEGQTGKCACARNWQGGGGAGES